MKPLHPLSQGTLCLWVLTLLLQTASPARATALDEWPLVLVSGGVTNIHYQPQLDSWDYVTLTAHAAIAVQPSGAPQPTFGVIDVSTKTFVDRVERMVFFEELQLTMASFPSAPAQASAWAASLRTLLPQQVRSLSLDRIEAGLAILEARQRAGGFPLRNDPPVIIFWPQPAMVVPVDGPQVAGRRGAVQNIYTGNYASGAQGVAHNTRTGTTAVGGKATVGNAYTGRSATAGRAAVYNPNTGRGTTVSGVRTDSGGAASIGNHTVATHDGKRVDQEDQNTKRQTQP